MNNLVDLHIHSISSDGIFKPSELVKMAADSGLTTIAIADHDSVGGINEAITAARQFGIGVIPAVELSVEYANYHDVHILGYWIDHTDPAFVKMLTLFRETRESRGLKIIDKINRKLASEGRTSIAISDVMALAEGALGRPHIARVLMENGYAANMQDAFTNYLQPCNVPKEYLPFEEAVKEILRIGGVPVLAHPQSITRNREELVRIITDMSQKGLGGIEVYNTMGFDGDAEFLRKLADSLGLAVTGGSDFHGTEEGLCMGKGRGNLYISEEVIESLGRKRAARS